jgi:hypothetical protein
MIDDDTGDDDFTDGYDASERGFDRSSNPYRSTSGAYSDWDRGFQSHAEGEEQE